MRTGNGGAAVCCLRELNARASSPLRCVWNCVKGQSIADATMCCGFCLHSADDLSLRQTEGKLEKARLPPQTCGPSASGRHWGNCWSRPAKWLFTQLKKSRNCHFQPDDTTANQGSSPHPHHSGSSPPYDGSSPPTSFCSPTEAAYRSFLRFS